MGFFPSFGFFGVLFAVFFILTAAAVLFTIIKFFRTQSSNNRAPRLTVIAAVVSKRNCTSAAHHTNAGDAADAHRYYTTADARYFVSFQVESGDRMELSLSGSEYSELTEGDIGRLTFQGSRFLKFEKIVDQ